ncbi:MAG: tetratricopeptide repeat protein [Pseudomonadota bacterium]
MTLRTPRCAVLLSMALLLSACTTAPVLRDAPTLADALFQPPTTPVDASQVFALTPAMQHYANTVLAPAMRHDSAEQALVDALYQQGQLKLEYDAELTRTAAGAFEARAGNCLSLVIMTGAFARYFDVPLRYQEVLITDTWSRDGDLMLANRHVNLSLLRPSGTALLSTEAGQDHELTVDFMPPPRGTRQRVRVISEATVTAMFMNNRAAELLAKGQLDDAYWWVRAAIKLMPRFTDSYNTLGVIYRQHGDLGEAEQILRHALLLEPENTMAMSNLVGVLKAAGQDAEATQLATTLARLEPFPPFHFYDQGLAALKAGQYETARALLQRELNRAAYQPDAHFWIGIAYLHLGQQRQAQKHLAKAIDNSTTYSTRALYSAKLDWLKSQGYEGRRDRRTLPSS